MKININFKLIYPCLAGLALFSIAMGVNRFSYTPIIPFLISHHWASGSQAGYIGSANFFGYFIGVYLARRLLTYLTMSNLAAAALLASIVAAALCTLQINYLWISAWRLCLGATAGILMVLSPTIILHDITLRYRGLVSGIIFAGVGVGIAATSLLIPVFNGVGGLFGIWLGLTALVITLSSIAFKKCRQTPDFNDKKPAIITGLSVEQKYKFTLASIAYGCYGIGLAPTMLFVSDYAHHNLHASLRWSSHLFALFGLGCSIGSVLGGWLHHRLGNYYAVLLSAATGVVSLMIIVTDHTLFAVAISTFLSGCYMLSLVVLMSLFVGSLVGIVQHAHYWAFMTLVYALSQFLAGYLFSAGLNFHLTYLTMFTVGLIFLALSLGLYVIIGNKPH